MEKKKERKKEKQHITKCYSEICQNYLGCIPVSSSCIIYFLNMMIFMLRNSFVTQVLMLYDMHAIYDCKMLIKTHY